ncbi:MAG: type II toxin-antitoxin system HicA family toxin [Actinomycetota bacterium]|nr:type II toxin-antitoxin system HicA family toxin [Actinomycetota bacterium]
MKVSDVIRLLEDDGWSFTRQRGSHRQFHHRNKGGCVTVPGHLGDEVPLGTLASILKQAGIRRPGR